MARSVLKGLPVSPGIAMGKLLPLQDARICEKRRISPDEVEMETESLEAASQKLCEKLQKTIQAIPDSLAEYREIIASQKELARDAKILDGAKARIKKRHICAAWALSDTIEELCGIFQDLSDPYLAERAQDIRMIGRSLSSFLEGPQAMQENLEQGILAAPDLSPADLIAGRHGNLQGILTSEGGVTSHTAILARGMKIPAIAAIPDLFRIARTGEDIIIDGLSGLVLLSPDEADSIFYKYRKENYESFERDAWKAASQEARSRDGKTLPIYANVENQFELGGLDNCGAEGIGLYRTEYAWLGEKIPDEEKLFREYSNVIAHARNKPVVFRTLDLGADKMLFGKENLHEPNPALGLRGIRFCLHRKDLFSLQLRAILRAAYNSKAALMLPMVTNLQEIEETRLLLNDIKHELARQKLPHAENMPLGIMVETPAAVMICDAIARNCDFLSLGTNDLLHFLMAIDRNNRHVAYLHEPLHPAFIRSLRTVITAAHKENIPVSVCGELGADPFGIALLLGLGMDRLSASPRFIPGLKHILRRLNAEDCAKLAKKALYETDVIKTRKNLHKVLNQALGSELDFHNSIIMDKNI